MADKAPTFLTKPSLRQEGSAIVFGCEIEAKPKPTVVWYRGDTKLSDDARIKASVESQGGDKYKLGLVVDTAGPDDSGSYKVEAKNKQGQMAANINLNLQGEPVSVSDMYRLLLLSFLEWALPLPLSAPLTVWATLLKSDWVVVRLITDLTFPLIFMINN